MDGILSPTDVAVGRLTLMLAVRSTYNIGRYVANEGDATFSTVAGYNGDLPVLVWCHGNNQTALSDYDGYNAQLQLLAQTHFVVAADFGGQTFGNDTGVTRVGQLLDYLGASTATLVGASMGGAVALNYAVRYPERVRAVAGLIPAVSFTDIAVDNPAKANLDLAYPPAYDDSNPDHAAHNPALFAASLPATMPIHLFTSSDDPTCPPSMADAFVAARPQTLRTVFGAYGHGGINVAAPLAAAWLASVRS